VTRPDQWIVEAWGVALGLMRSWDVPVAEVDGWEDRGRPWAFNPRCLRNHHTATWGYEYDYASLGIVRDGRSDLPGPLSQGGMGRHTGTFYMIAAGYSNDGGEGGWEGLVGNGSGIGIEHENDGIGEEWSPLVRRNSVLANAAICIAFEIDPARMVCEHFEWSPFKIDRNNYGNPDDFRAAVAAVVANGGPNEEEEDDMFQPGDAERLERVESLLVGNEVRWEELKKYLAEAAGTDNWHGFGRALDGRFDRLEQKVAAGGGSVDTDALAEQVAALVDKKLAERLAN
jgi:hypothetical protein